MDIEIIKENYSSMGDEELIHLSTHDGTYIITWGAIIFGAIRFFVV